MALKLHCIGDSHCCFFLGYDHMPPEYPFVAKSLMHNISCYRLGPVLAYNAGRYNTTTQGREKLEKIIGELDPKTDILLLSFGEIDCRAHLLKQIHEHGKLAMTVVQECVANYAAMIKTLAEQGFQIIIWNAVYSANYLEQNNDLEFPYYGKVEERNQITRLYNQELKAASEKAGASFLDISGLLIDETTGLTRMQYYFDSIHLNNHLFLTVVKKIRRITGGRMFNISDRLEFRWNLLRRRISSSFGKNYSRIKRKLEFSF